MKDYSINLRTLVENHKTNTALGGSPPVKPSGLNPTQIKMEEIKDKLRRFAEEFYTPEELKKAHPVHNSQDSITKLHNEMIKIYQPTPEEALKVSIANK